MVLEDALPHKTAVLDKNWVLPIVNLTKIGNLMLAVLVSEIECRHTEKWPTCGVSKTAAGKINLTSH
jgi:hypothetical protein